MRQTPAQRTQPEHPEVLTDRAERDWARFQITETEDVEVIEAYIAQHERTAPLWAVRARQRLAEVQALLKAREEKQRRETDRRRQEAEARLRREREQEAHGQPQQVRSEGAVSRFLKAILGGRALREPKRQAAEERISIEKDKEIHELRRRLKSNLQILRVAHQIIYPDIYPRYYIEKDIGEYTIYSNTDTLASREIEVRALDAEVFFQRLYIYADPESDPIHDIDQINLSITSEDQTTEVLWLPIDEQPLSIQILVYFLPLIPPGEKRTFNLTFLWPGYFKSLLSSNCSRFSWALERHEENFYGRFCKFFDFSSELGNIDCTSTGANPAGASLECLESPFQEFDVRWIYRGDHVPMNDVTYELLFTRQS